MIYGNPRNDLADRTVFVQQNNKFENHIPSLSYNLQLLQAGAAGGLHAKFDLLTSLLTTTTTLVSQKAAPKQHCWSFYPFVPKQYRPATARPAAYATRFNQSTMEESGKKNQEQSNNRDLSPYWCIYIGRHLRGWVS